MSELTRLREDHAKLARLFGTLRHVIERREPPPQVELFDLRRDLMGTLIAHLKLEDWALYPRLIESGDAQMSETGTAFKDEMGGLWARALAWGHGLCRDRRTWEMPLRRPVIHAAPHPARAMRESPSPSRGEGS